MVRLGFNRIVAALILGVLLVTYINHDYAKWGRLGRDAFATYQMGRFDRYMAPNHPLSVSIFGSLAIAAFAAGIYELLALLISKILPAKKS